MFNGCLMHLVFYSRLIFDGRKGFIFHHWWCLIFRHAIMRPLNSLLLLLLSKYGYLLGLIWLPVSSLEVTNPLSHLPYLGVVWFGRLALRSISFTVTGRIFEFIIILVPIHCGGRGYFLRCLAAYSHLLLAQQLILIQFTIVLRRLSRHEMLRWDFLDSLPSPEALILLHIVIWIIHHIVGRHLIHHYLRISYVLIIAQCGLLFINRTLSTILKISHGFHSLQKLHLKLVKLTIPSACHIHVAKLRPIICLYHWTLH